MKRKKSFCQLAIFVSFFAILSKTTQQAHHSSKYHNQLSNQLKHNQMHTSGSHDTNPYQQAHASPQLARSSSIYSESVETQPENKHFIGRQEDEADFLSASLLQQDPTRLSSLRRTLGSQDSSSSLIEPSSLVSTDTSGSGYEIDGSTNPAVTIGGVSNGPVPAVQPTIAGDSDETAAVEQNTQAGLEQHNSQLAAMQEMFERRQLARQPTVESQANQPELQSSQELSPISIGLDPSGPFSMTPFSMPGGGVGGGPDGSGMSSGGPRGPMSSADDAGLGPVSLSFGLNQLPHLLGFQSPPSAFDGSGGPATAPARGDHHHHGSAMAASGDPDSVPQNIGGQKVWPKIFRFTDGRINLSDFEKQKKIRLSNKNQMNGGAENHIESAPIMFDGRQLKRKSFLILHGGIFSKK